MKKMYWGGLLALLCLASCREKKNYYYTPTIGVEVQGGTSGQTNSAIPSSSSSEPYKPYQGGAYWGEEGRSTNRHYVPYSEREKNYNHYRGTEE